MDNEKLTGWRRDLRKAVFISAPFWAFAILGFYPAMHAGHGGLAFVLVYGFILLPGVLTAAAFSPDGGATPWALGLGLILFGQFGAIYVLARLCSSLRRLRARRANH